jgi:hypothetical protein
MASYDRPSLIGSHLNVAMLPPIPDQIEDAMAAKRADSELRRDEQGAIRSSAA